MIEQDPFNLFMLFRQKQNNTKQNPINMQEVDGTEKISAHDKGIQARFGCSLVRNLNKGWA